ncbi:MAG: TonB-dependent receptor [Sinimarinibacterium flocculans]|uniref:TonB-dependent receptor n=1 Tax=Sinimarinibacterium flocculans TaxID=985250 RepID=UPI003C39A8AC
MKHRDPQSARAVAARTLASLVLVLLGAASAESADTSADDSLDFLLRDLQEDDDPTAGGPPAASASPTATRSEPEQAQAPAPEPAADMASIPVTGLRSPDTEDAEPRRRSRPRQPLLEEIVVTARRREESLQETPVAVTAMSAEALSAAGVSSITDLQQIVPGLQFGESATKTPSIFIRGVGQRDASAELDPGVGVYLNGIFIARQDTQLLDTVDTESIQVLRGPQGTLFGKNNTGGAMLVTTRAPDLGTPEFGGTAKAGNFGRLDLRLHGNLPLIDDRLGLRVAVNSKNYDGYLENIDDGTSFGDEKRLAAAARLLWNVTDSLSADGFLFWSRQDERSTAVTCLYQNPQANVAQLHYPARPDFETACRESEAAARDGKVSLTTADSVIKMDNLMTALTLSWDLADLQIKSISAWSHQYNIERNDDQDGTAVDILSTGSRALNRNLAAAGIDAPGEYRDQYSQELQINGDLLDGRVSYTTGLFLSRETMNNNTFGSTVGPNGLAGIDPSTVTDILIPGLPNLGSLLVFPLATYIATRSDLQNDSAAVFAQGTWNATEWLQLTLGARYTFEDRWRDLDVFPVDSVAYAQRIGAVYIDPAGFYSPITRVQFDALGRNVPDLPLIENLGADVREEQWRNFTPSATVSLLATPVLLERFRLDSGMLYFTYSEGFKAGGFSPRGAELVSFEPEEVANYEIGLKLDAVDSRLRINAALFYMDYTNIQVRVAEQGERFSDIFLFMSNAGAATIAGAEIEATALFGELMLFASANYTDAEYQVFEGQIINPGQGVTTTDRSDEPFGLVPEASYAAGLQYNWMTPIGMFVPRLQMYYRDELFTGLDYRAVEYPSSTIDEVTLWNARVTCFLGEHLSLAAFVNNLTDEHYFKSGFSVSAALGAATLVQGEPRTYGVELSWAF